MADVLVNNLWGTSALRHLADGVARDRSSILPAEGEQLREALCDALTGMGQPYMRRADLPTLLWHTAWMVDHGYRPANPIGINRLVYEVLDARRKRNYPPPGEGARVE